MKDTNKAEAKKGGKKKMSGWLIALIVIAVIFLAGAICCNTIGKAQGTDKSVTQSTVDIQKK